MKNYKILLFDSDDTLLDFKKAEHDALCSAMTECGLEFTEELCKVYSEANKVYWKAFENGEIEKQEIYVGRFELFLKNAGIAYSAAELATRYEELLKKQFCKIEGAEQTCKALKDRYEMHIVSNGNVLVQLPRLDGSGLRPYFKEVFVSERVGFQKPQREFFDFVFAYLGNPNKSEVLIIGDSISSDILGGINAGIDTCLFGTAKNSGDIKPTYTVKNHNELRKLLLESEEII